MSSPHAIPDVSLSQLIKAMGRFDRTDANTNDWKEWTSNLSHKYAIFHEMKLYPVKKVISLATGLSVTEFSGGSQANKYVESRGFKVISLRAFSWTVESGGIASKVLDRSAFIYDGTGIPQEIKWYFLNVEDTSASLHQIALIHNGQTYNGSFEFSSHGSERIRLFWDSAFAELLHTSFPFHFQQYKDHKEPESSVVMRLQRLDGYNSYEITFAGELAGATVAKDIEAEQLEEQGLGLEGQVRQYYGKRYERNPKNRQAAIKYHGLTCNVCGFNFEQAYGERGSGYIEVHHVKPISTFESQQHVDPKADLITLCANCHRMAHRDSGNVLSVHELRSILGKR